VLGGLLKIDISEYGNFSKIPSISKFDHLVTELVGFKEQEQGQVVLDLLDRASTDCVCCFIISKKVASNLSENGFRGIITKSYRIESLIVLKSLCILRVVKKRPAGIKTMCYDFSQYKVPETMYKDVLLKSKAKQRLLGQEPWL